MTVTRWVLVAVLPVVAASVVLSESAGWRAVSFVALIVGVVGFWAEGRTRAAARRNTNPNNANPNNTNPGNDQSDTNPGSGPDGQ